MYHVIMVRRQPIKVLMAPTTTALVPAPILLRGNTLVLALRTDQAPARESFARPSEFDIPVTPSHLMVSITDLADDSDPWWSKLNFKS